MHNFQARDGLAVHAGRQRKKPRGLHVAQLCPSIGRACGVGNFANNLKQALVGRGVQIATHERLPSASNDVLLVQHEFALFRSHELRNLLAAWPGPRVLFAHSRGAEVFTDDVDGFVSMCPGMTGEGKPALVLPHPGWLSLPLLDRRELKRSLGWGRYRCIVGSHGFISPSRQFDVVAERLLPFARRQNVLLHVLCPRHGSHDDRPGYRDQEARLHELQRRYPRHLALETRFLDQRALNERLQACDLLWCWTATPSVPYGSGTCADQYGSGTRLVIADKLQHSHVCRLPNVVATDPNLDALVGAVQAEIRAGGFARHDPSELSWSRFADRLQTFLRTIKRGPRRLGPIALQELTARVSTRELAGADGVRPSAGDAVIAAAVAGRSFRCQWAGGRPRTLQFKPSGKVGNAWGREKTLWSIDHGRLVLAAHDGKWQLQFEPEAGGIWASTGLCGFRVEMKLLPTS